MSKFRRHLIAAMQRGVEYLTFEDANESKYWAIYYGDSYKGKGYFGERILKFQNVESAGLLFWCPTEGVTAHKSARAIRRSNSTNNMSKSDAAESISIQIFTENSETPWEVDEVTATDYVLQIGTRLAITATTTIETITKNDFLSSFTYDGEKWSHDVTIPKSRSVLYLGIKANPGSTIHLKLYANSSNHIHPIGVSKKQIQVLTDVNSRFCNGLIKRFEGIRYCDNPITLHMGKNTLYKFYGGKVFTVKGDNAFQSSNLTYVLLPRFTSSTTWIFRGSSLRHADLGWITAFNSIINYHEFTDTEGWTMVLRSNNPLSVTKTLEDGTIFVPESLINNYAKQQNVVNSRGLLIAPIGGTEWQAAFAAATDPTSEYANVEVYCPEWYDEYMVDYAAAKASATPAGDNTIVADTYDAEIEYLETDGTAYIDTNVIETSKTRFELEFYVSSFTAPTSAKALFGARGGITWQCCVTIDANASTIIWHRGNKNSSSKAFTSGLWQFSNMQNSNTLVTNNGNLSAANQGKYSSTSKFYIFASSWGSGTHYGIPNLRFNTGKITNGATLVRDYIPVRVGQVGYLFDKISKKLFGNANDSGAFILGPDKTT